MGLGRLRPTNPALGRYGDFVEVRLNAMMPRIVTARTGRVEGHCARVRIFSFRCRRPYP